MEKIYDLCNYVKKKERYRYVRIISFYKFSISQFSPYICNSIAKNIRLVHEITSCYSYIVCNDDGFSFFTHPFLQYN